MHEERKGEVNKCKKPQWFRFGGWLNARSPKPRKRLFEILSGKEQRCICAFSEEHIQTIKDSVSFRGDCCVLKIKNPKKPKKTPKTTTS